MTLGEKQRLFTRLIGKLIEYAYGIGYELTFGDAYRSPEQAKLNAAAGKGIVNSLHCERLAIDLNRISRLASIGKRSGQSALGAVGFPSLTAITFQSNTRGAHDLYL